MEKRENTVKDGLPTAEEVIDKYPMEKDFWSFVISRESAIQAMQEYSDQQNAELMEQNRKNQSRWAKDRVAQDKKHDADMMEACGKIVDLEERVKELEAKNESLIELAERAIHYVSYALKDDYRKQLDALKK